MTLWNLANTGFTARLASRQLSCRQNGASGWNLAFSAIGVPSTIFVKKTFPVSLLRISFKARKKFPFWCYNNSVKKIR